MANFGGAQQAVRMLPVRFQEHGPQPFGAGGGGGRRHAAVAALGQVQKAASALRACFGGQSVLALFQRFSLARETQEI